MRTFFQVPTLPRPREQGAILAALAPAVAVLIACGGGHVGRESVQSPDPTSASSSLGPAANTPASGALGGASTTTATLEDAADLHGRKLTEVSPMGSTSASAGSPSKGPHGHDPGRGQDDIRAILIAHRDDARACYDRALNDHPGIEGDLVISWTIDPKGSVTQTSLDMSRSQIAEPSLVACVTEVVKKIQFAPSPGGYETRASYPFNFHPRHQKPPQ